MALDSRDLFVVQRTFGGDAGKNFKTTAEEIAEFIASTPAVHYMGAADFTDVADTPSNPQDGDLWVNNQQTPGRFAWTPEHAPRDPDDGTSALPVDYFDKCIWNATESRWDVFATPGDDTGGTLTAITAQAPLVVDDTDPAEPDLKIRLAKFSDGSTYVREFPIGDEPGVVSSIALESDVAIDPNDPDAASPNPNAVVTAALLKKTNEELRNATQGGITDVNDDFDGSISNTSRWSQTYQGSSYTGDHTDYNKSVTVLPDPANDPDSTIRVVRGQLAETDTPGAFLAPVDDDVNPDNANTSADGGLSKVHAVTPNLVYEFYTPRNFDLLDTLP